MSFVCRNSHVITCHLINSFHLISSQLIHFVIKFSIHSTQLDTVKRNYKTAEETDDSKGKYWVILGVLLFGSFTIPMIQYYWYVADDD